MSAADSTTRIYKPWGNAAIPFCVMSQPPMRGARRLNWFGFAVFVLGIAAFAIPPLRFLTKVDKGNQDSDLVESIPDSPLVDPRLSGWLDRLGGRRTWRAADNRRYRHAHRPGVDA